MIRLVVVIESVESEVAIVSSNEQIAVSNDFSLQVSHLVLDGSINVDTTVNTETSTSLDITFPIKRDRDTRGDVSFTLEHGELVGEQSLVKVRLWVN